VSPELAAALRLDRDVRRRGAQETVELPEGLVIGHAGLPIVHYLNAVLLRAPLADQLDAPALVALAEQWLGHLEHRYVVLDDGVAGERLAPELLARGWERRRTVFMVFAGDPATANRDPRARELTEAEMQALQLANFEQADYGPNTSPGLPVALAAAQRALRAGTDARCFGAGEDGGLQSICTLFLDPDSGGERVAMVEEVATLSAYRERGLARAVVSAALLAAGRWGADVITVPADADDWPQLMYAKLGFEPVGTQVSFTLRTGRRVASAAP
jgi:GNAT superfamily N-acetyltransferase